MLLGIILPASNFLSNYCSMKYENWFLLHSISDAMQWPCYLQFCCMLALSIACTQTVDLEIVALNRLHSVILHSLSVTSGIVCKRYWLEQYRLQQICKQSCEPNTLGGDQFQSCSECWKVWILKNFSILKYLISSPLYLIDTKSLPSRE